jgi:tRNA-dihydrouridine synthase A
MPTVNAPHQPLLSIAPMMEWTDRHYRFFMRFLTKRTLLYTEMITSAAILRGNRKYLLDFSPEELPLVLQLGGDNPLELGEAAKIGEDWGYSEINLNVGCPSEKVQQGSFGACLMARPELVAECVKTMKSKVQIPITVKHRIGIDGLESYSDLKKFVQIVADAGCDRFIVHARIAILGGLSPAENRKIPPLRYEDVYRLKSEFTDLKIEINGGIQSLKETEEHLQNVDGVMIGRAAYENPYLFSKADSLIFEEKNTILSRLEILQAMIPYIENHVKQGGKTHHIVRHCFGLLHGEPGAKLFRRFLTENMYTKEPKKLLEEVIFLMSKER